MEGSGIGPTLFIIWITYLKLISSTNYITKYSDDSNLLVPEKYDVDLSEELRNVLKLVENNKMQVNMAKTKEIVFHRSIARNVLFTSELPCIEGVLCSKLLDVSLQADMGVRKHVDYILHICNQRTYCPHNQKGKDYHRRNYKVFLMQ